MKPLQFEIDTRNITEEEQICEPDENREQERISKIADIKKPAIRDTPLGILRLDIAPKQRRSPSDMHISVQEEPPSPQPSVDRLSVTFADGSVSVRSDSSTRHNIYIPLTTDKSTMDQIQSTATDCDDSDEDYSVSVNAIIQRKESQRKSRKRSSRRTSSPFSPDILPSVTHHARRRSSAYTTSSGDTAITIDECLEPTEEQIFENIKLHKEVLSSVKMQPWNMRKKLKLVMQAKNYVKKHEGALQERLTQKHSIKNMLARWDIYFVKLWQSYQREIANMSIWLTPWERRIKEIESHFGSVVASYFTFLRWIFWVNFVMSVILVAFVAIPEMIIVSAISEPERKQVLPEERYNSTNFLTLWDFEGVFKYSPIFYGWYTNKENYTGYRLPLAYFLAQLTVYIYSFVTTLNKMAENSRMSKLSEKGDECIFSWKLFTAWDYMIGNPETAQNRVMSIVLGFKEALLEEAEKKRTSRNWKIIGIRIFVNLVILTLFALSAAAVVIVVNRSAADDAKSSIWRRNETTVVVTLISFVVPIIMEFLGMIEGYHPRKQLRVQLARIMLLNLLNLYSLIYAQFDAINDMSEDLAAFKPNVTPIPVDFDMTMDSEIISLAPADYFYGYTTEVSDVACRLVCFDVPIGAQNISSANLLNGIATKIATTVFPRLWSSNTKTSESFIEDTTPMGNFSEFLYENSTIYNQTVCCDNNTDYNFTSELNMFPNMDFMERFSDVLQGYLTSMLEKFSDTEMRNTTEVNLTEMWENCTTYEEFKTTMLPFFPTNTTYLNEDERFETDMSTLYYEIGTLVSTVQNVSSPAPICEEICVPTLSPIVSSTYNYIPTESTIITEVTNSYQNRSKLRNLCWETMFGQELVKLTVLDLVFSVAGAIGVDFVRGVFVRVMNRCWCWDLEKKFPEYGEFKVAENILHLVSNQGVVWMGMFFSPGLVLINVVKLIILMYLRSWAVLTCNVPHEVIFRASRSNNFYIALLLIMLFLCVLPVGYAIVWVEPSWHCGPFSHYLRMFHIFTKTVRKILPKTLQKPLDYMVSPGIVIPLLVLLVLIIYYLISLTNSLREANADLKTQLRQERTEERRKMFQIADRRRRGGISGTNELDTPFAKWKKLLGTLPCDTLRKDMSLGSDETATALPSKTKDIVSKFIKSALKRTSSATSEDNQKCQDDGTDTEQPESIHTKHTKAVVLASSTIVEDHQTISDSISCQRKDKGAGVQILPRRDSLSTRKSRWQNRDHSPSHSSSTKDDSVASTWSDGIPVITISKTESSDCILENNQNETNISNDNPDEPTVSSIEQSNNGPHALEEHCKPRIKHMFKKQSDICDFEDPNEIPDDSEEDESTRTTVKSNIFLGGSRRNSNESFIYQCNADRDS